MRGIWLLVVLLLIGCGETLPTEAEPPNLILIIGDDHGYRDFGFMGSPYVKTPHLDRLAHEGMVFDTAYVTASICRPTLRSLLTGLYPAQWRHRIKQLERRNVKRRGTRQIQDFRTLPGLLAEHGYLSFQGGKFFEASYRLAGFTHGLQRNGDNAVWGGSSLNLGRATTAPLYEFMDAHRNEPFFVWYAPYLPHLPHDAGRDYLKLYAGLGLSSVAIGYYANISRFDDLIGELVEYLDESGLRDRTLIVYLADNGWDQNPRDPQFRISGGPKGKRTMYELGFRTPIVFNWPGHVPAGIVENALVSSLDLFPTFLDYAGVPAPEGYPGRSLRPVLEGTGGWPRRALIGEMPDSRRPGDETSGDDPREWVPAYFVRTRTWHYIWYPNQDIDELFELASDPQEERNVADENTALIRDFRKQINEWRAQVSGHLPRGPRSVSPTEPSGS